MTLWEAQGLSEQNMQSINWKTVKREKGKKHCNNSPVFLFVNCFKQTLPKTVNSQGALFQKCMYFLFYFVFLLF